MVCLNELVYSEIGCLQGADFFGWRKSNFCFIPTITPFLFSGANTWGGGDFVLVAPPGPTQGVLTWWQ